MAQVDESTTITIADANFHEITDYTDGDSTNGGFVFQNTNELKCVVPGEYMVFQGISVKCSVANQLISSCVAVNGTTEQLTTGRQKTGSSGDEIDISGQYFIQLAKDDIVTHQVKNAQSNDVEILQASVVLMT